MRPGSGWQVALRVGLAVSATLMMRGPTIAEQRDGSHQFQAGAASGPVFFRVTDLELAPDKVVFAQAQPLAEEATDTVAAPPPVEPAPAEPAPPPAEPAPAAPAQPRRPTGVRPPKLGVSK